MALLCGGIHTCKDDSGNDFDVYVNNCNDNRHLLRKSTVALLCRDIPLCSLPYKVTFLLLGVDPLAELISAVHLSNKIIPSQMEVAPLHCTVDITRMRRPFRNTKEIEKM